MESEGEEWHALVQFLRCDVSVYRVRDNDNFRHTASRFRVVLAPLLSLCAPPASLTSPLVLPSIYLLILNLSASLILNFLL